MLHKINSFIDHCEVFEAEKVHFQQTHRLHIFHEVLSNHLAIVVALQGDQFIKGLRCNHHASRVYAKGLVCALNTHCHINPALYHWVLFIFLPKFWSR